ncbi:clathrin assembly protein AP47 [Gymnopus androsaceus JB14]|uniref:Clathrin assembly protein AP47 n=1 Tax=Gymnopus androsaceus JB14 TaxID=1447944 RepID=A0A6A4I7N5_9AGAR|nr:clathrin assembly protein AP47 [Gymnopus androsaceus JB14]
MASLIAILDVKGKPLIQRMYRDDVPVTSLEQFIPIIYEMEEENQQIVPCFTRDGVNYMHIKHSNLYLLAVSRRNTNAMEALIFLNKLKEVLIEYFKALEEESIRDNFVVIYELMDEMMDFGHPQATESKILQEYITQEYHALEIQQQAKSLASVTNAVSWRSEGLKYKRNEVFLDVIESVNMLVNTSGSVVRSEILGQVAMKCYLSGMPELRLGLNDKVATESSRSGAKAIEMEDMRFHQCVRLARFESDRTISFIPPDGEFELMSYRISTHIEKPLIWVEASVNHFGTRIQFTVKVTAQFKRSSSANNVEIVVPVPEDADTPKFKVPAGSASYAPDKSAFVWKLKKLPGGKDYTMRAELSLPTVRSSDVDYALAAEKGQRQPITVKFEIPYFTVSGIKVRYLKTIEKSGYQAVPWVRYITQNGDYSLRTGSLPSAAARGDGYEDH